MATRTYSKPGPLTVDQLTPLVAQSWSGNVATYTLKSLPGPEQLEGWQGFAVGNQIRVGNSLPAGYNGIWTIATIPAPTNVVTALTYGNGQATITTTSAHGFAAGQTIQLAGFVPAAWNGYFTVLAVPTSSTATIQFSIDYLMGTLAAPTTFGSAGAIVFTVANASNPGSSTQLGSTAPPDFWTYFASTVFTDTTTHHPTLAAINAPVLGPLVFACLNTTNQAMSIKYQGSIDGLNWTDLGAGAQTLAAGANRVDDISDPWPFVRGDALAQVAPASGAVEFQYSWREDI